MTAILHSWISAMHLAASGVAIVTGTGSLLGPKGRRQHRYWGLAYAGSMSVVLGTAFGIYTLFGRFGLVHWGAVGSALALLVGVGAVALRAVVPRWRQWHYLGMGASVVSLYAALAGESTYRLLPATYFWWSTLGPASAVLLLGALLLYHYYPAAPARLRRTEKKLFLLSADAPA